MQCLKDKKKDQKDQEKVEIDNKKLANLYE